MTEIFSFQPPAFSSWELVAGSWQLNSSVTEAFSFQPPAFSSWQLNSSGGIIGGFQLAAGSWELEAFIVREIGMAELNQQQVVDYIKGISVLELSQLVKALEQELGVSAAAAMPMAMPAGGGAAAGGAAPAEEKTEFTAVLTEVGTNKINVIKVVREVTSLGLKEAKDLVEGAPKPIKEGIPKDEAAAIQKKFADVGAKVEIK